MNTFPNAIYTLRGIVEHGDRRGRQLGFPTANICKFDALPSSADGVWAGWVILEGRLQYLASISVGTRSTFYSEGVRLVESFILDFRGDLYGSEIEVALMVKIRDQFEFESSDELVLALKSDVEATQKLWRRSML